MFSFFIYFYLPKMFSTLLIIAVSIYVVHLLIKYIYKPYMRMQAFKGIDKVYIIPFVPLIGAFYLAEKSYKQKGDENYFAKIAYETYPNVRALIANGLDRIFIILTDPELLKSYYLNQKHYVKERFFIENRIRIFGDGVAFAEGKQWAKRRKIMSSIFHFSFFETFVPKIIAIAEKQLEEIASNPNKTQPLTINSMQFSSKIAGRTIVKSFFGLQFQESIQNQQLSVFLQKLVAKVGTQQRTVRSFMFGQKLLKLGLFGPDREINHQISIFRAMVKDTITKKLQDSNQQEGTLLKMLIDKKLIDTQQGLTKDQLIEEFLTLFIAGTDTTSHLMGMLFYYLSIYPQIQSKLRQQLQGLKKEDINYKSITSLKYLNNVIKQTFRHYDYMVSTFPRVALDDHELGDLKIKKGDMLMPGWAQLNYHPEYFPNPNEFNPQRWEQAEKKPDIDMVFSPFSNGSRSCLGKNFALLESKIATYMLLTKYQLKLKQGYVHLLKAAALYGPVNPIIIELYPVQEMKV